MAIKRCLLLMVLSTLYLQAEAQKVFTRQGNISFYSDAPMEKIEAHNHKATCVMDLSSGLVEWAVLIKAFAFEKALMQEHFNENYMESGKFPKATFKGKFVNYTTIDLGVDGEHRYDVEGDLTIRNKTQKVTAPVLFTVNNGKLLARTDLTVKVADYGIEIPKLVRENIAKEVVISIEADLEVLDQ